MYSLFSKERDEIGLSVLDFFCFRRLQLFKNLLHRILESSMHKTPPSSTSNLPCMLGFIQLSDIFFSRNLSSYLN